MGEELCECEEEVFPIVVGIDTAAGKIIGFSISEVFAGALLICSFMIIFVLVHILFPKIRKLDLRIQRWLTGFLNGLLKKGCGVGMFSTITGTIVEFLVSLRPPFHTYLIGVGILIGVFLHYTNLNVTLEKELMQINLDIFIVTYLSAGAIKGTFMATRRKLHFPNFILTFFHHYVLSFLHGLGTFFIIFMLSFVLYFFLFAKYSYLECLLLSSIVSIMSGGAILGALDGLNVNLRLFEVLEGEDMLSIIVCIMVYGAALPLTLNSDDDVSTWEMIGLGFVRILYMITIGPIIGLSFGFIGCIIVKLLNYPKDLRIFQPFVIYIFMFLSFFISEMCKGHGLLALIPCSIFMARYTYFAMTEKMRDRTEYLLGLFAAVAGQFVYLYVGITFFETLFDTHWDFLLILYCNIFLLLFRGLYVISIDSVWNIFSRVLPSDRPKSIRIIPRREVFVLAFSGLKEALPFIFAFVLPRDLNDKNHGLRDLFITTTTMVIIPSLLIQVPIMTSILPYLNLKKRRLSIEDKVSYCMNMIESLEKCKLFVPHKDRCCTSSTRLKRIMAAEVNENWKNFRGFAKDYYEAMKYEKERREKHFCWPKSKFSVRIMHKGFELMEKVYEWSNNAVIDQPNPDIMIRISKGIGVDEEDLKLTISLVGEMGKQSDIIQEQLCGLLKLKQYGESLVKIPDERYMLKMKEVGHIPFSVSPDNLDQNQKDEVEVEVDKSEEKQGEDDGEACGGDCELKGEEEDGEGEKKEKDDGEGCGGSGDCEGGEKEQETEKKDKKDISIKGCFLFSLNFVVGIWDKVDVLLQRLINIKGIETKENIFLTTTLLYRKFHWVSWDDDDDEDRLFLDDLDFKVVGKKSEQEEEEEQSGEDGVEKCLEGIDETNISGQ